MKTSSEIASYTLEHFNWSSYQGDISSQRRLPFDVMINEVEDFIMLHFFSPDLAFLQVFNEAMNRVWELCPLKDIELVFSSPVLLMKVRS